MMTHVIEAIYEGGVLRPLEPLILAEQSQVKIQILETASPSTAADETRRAEAVLIAAGLIEPLAPTSDIPHISEDRRRELANLYAVGGPLSQMVIAEREER